MNKPRKDPYAEVDALIMTTEEVAAHFGVKPDSVRKLLHRHNVRLVHGYPRAAIMAIERPGPGWWGDRGHTIGHPATRRNKTEETEETG